MPSSTMLAQYQKQHWFNVPCLLGHVGPTLYKCYTNVLCLLGYQHCCYCAYVLIYVVSLMYAKLLVDIITVSLVLLYMIVRCCIMGHANKLLLLLNIICYS